MKAKRLFTLSALLAVTCMLVALLFGSTIGARTAKAEETAFEPVSYRYAEDENHIVMVDLLDEKNARLRLIEQYGDGSTEHARLNAVYEINDGVLSIDAMNGDLQYDFNIESGYTLTVLETEDNTDYEDYNTEETPTFGSRISEWFSDNFLEFLSSVDLVAVVGAIVAIILEKKSNKKNTQETKTSIKENTAEIKRNTESNDEVLRVANLLIDSTNALAASEEKRDVDVAQLLVLNKAVLEILVTVYVNNKNIPQATKDLVNMKYVAALTGGKSETPDEAKEVSEG